MWSLWNWLPLGVVAVARLVQAEDKMRRISARLVSTNGKTTRYLNDHI